ncbi:MAG: hypothetical protein A2W80_08080 [Candidatus Riflebacteria bacterium GWC2_50_8]|nr:MAG: hypothetical protein A2W80_08080 [Candidatus Riflebacteria bacterium GWC2_50_8]
MRFQNIREKALPERSGYILYLVMSLLLVWAIMSFSLSTFKSGSVSLLTRTSMQSRLTCAASGGMNEIWAMARQEANDKSGKSNPLHFYSLLNAVFDQNENEIPPKKTFVSEKFFDSNDLPFANVMAGEISGNDIRVKGHCRLFFTKLIRKSPQSFSGHIEVIVQAVSKSDSREFIEIKERRDFKIIDTRDLLDRYALYVKDYGFDYNKIRQKLVIEGLGPKVRSSVYLGSRYAPNYPAFKNLAEPAPIYFDFNFKDDKVLLSALLNNNSAVIPQGGQEIPSSNPKVRTGSSGNIFWSIPIPLRFKPIFDRGSFTDSDFYTVKALQDGYYKTFVETSQKAGGEEHSLAGLILEDWKNCGGNYADSQVFKMVVTTSVDSWGYLYAYTDAQSLWNGDLWSDFAKTFQFTGLNEYIKFMKNYHPDKMISGSMPQIFGPERNKPVTLEGNVFFRFFKIAFFDEFDAVITLAGESKKLGMPAIPLHFQDPADNSSNFLNKEVRIHGIEKQLMSREVDEIPVNSLFSAGVSSYPEGVASPDNVFLTLSTDVISYKYKNSQDFFADNTMLLANGEKRLKVDGVTFIEKGNLDLSGYSSFSGQGLIWIGFRGDIYLGDLAKSKPSDILKLWAQDGSFIIKSDKPDVKISASLLALTYFSDPLRTKSSLGNRGKLIANKHGIEITGNLAVDYLFTADKNYGIPEGKKLVIKHDPFLFSPVYPKWTTLGPVRTIYSVNADSENRFFK